MRFESVRAWSFGPFTNQVLEFAPKITVIYGRNESGKSTWHAALFASLCGIRRARGKPREDDAQFEARHRPWESKEWEVIAQVTLDDGRRIELRQNLLRKDMSRVVDATTGRDVTGDLINEGSPDGAKWLGLDRKSFAAVACVRQADIQGVIDDAQTLQDELQRAAATGGSDATAAAAIELLRGYQREHVGRDLTHTSKPLRAALQCRAQAIEALQSAQASRDEYARLITNAEHLEQAAAVTRTRLEAARAARLYRDVERARSRTERARTLAARHPNGAPPSLPQDDDLAQRLATAINAWETRPEVPALTGPDSDALRGVIAALPAVPMGDQEPHTDVTTRYEEYLKAKHALDVQLDQKPTELDGPDVGGASADELRDLSREFEIKRPRVDPIRDGRRGELEANLMSEATARSRRRVLAVSGAVLVVAGGAAWLAGFWRFGAVLVGSGVACCAAWALRSGHGLRAKLLEELRSVEQALGEQMHAARDVEHRLNAARDRVIALGLSPEPEVLRRLADRLTVAIQGRLAMTTWDQRRVAFENAMETTRRAVIEALRQRNGDAAVDLQSAVETYKNECRARAAVAAQAAQRSSLEAQLVAREAAESAARAAKSRRAEAERMIRATAADCQFHEGPAEDLVEKLRLWHSARTATLAAHEIARSEWAELMALLDGRSLADLEGEYANLVAAAGKEAHEPSDPELVTADLDRELKQRQQQCEDATTALANARGQANQYARSMLNVAEAEEELARAEATLVRVQTLDRMLSRTIEFLESAQERTHRDIASRLNAEMRVWLPRITEGRYIDARVNPESLAVEISDAAGHWRDATLLSHGTAEQVYLLLRIAMAKHLAVTGESCPLILDDVTVQCDRERTTALLVALRTISEGRQVILFTQEDDVLEWARSNVRTPEDRLIELDAVLAT
jgi:DNA repair exonuclease SbcCD ATPase subunit